MTQSRRIVAALVLIASAFGAARADEPDKIKLGEFIPATPPQPAPEISLADMAGNPVSLGDLKGKFILLNLWATWCQPCLKEMPSLAALQARLGPSLAVLAVSEDRGGGDAVRPFLAEHGIDKLEILLDPKSAATRAFATRGLPTSMVIDRDGRVLGKVEGAADWDSDAMRAVLAGLMALRPASGEATPR